MKIDCLEYLHSQFKFVNVVRAVTLIGINFILIVRLKYKLSQAYTFPNDDVVHFAYSH